MSLPRSTRRGVRAPPRIGSTGCSGAASTSSSRSMAETVRRGRSAVPWRTDVAWAVGAAAVVAACSAAIDGSRVTDMEASAFRAVNDLSGGIYPVLWPLMQFGTFVSIPIVVVIALVFRRVRLAIEAAAAGVSAYLVAKIVKGLFP